MDLSNIETSDLINELKERGYFTELIFGVSDVDFILKGINSEREDYEGDVIELDDYDKRTILEECFNSDWYSERMNEDIEQKILDEYDDETYYKKVDNVVED